MPKPWLIDELAHAGPEHLDPAFVAGYDRKQGFDPTEDVAVLRAHGLTKASTLVDLGVGTGRLALASSDASSPSHFGDPCTAPAPAPKVDSRSAGGGVTERTT